MASEQKQGGDTIVPASASAPASVPASSPASATLADATKILRTGLKKADVQLKPFQQEVIAWIVDKKHDVLYIDRTGAGKSETYFVAAKLLRNADKRAGPVIVITPLVALIHDQVRRAKAFGLKAEGYFSADKGMSEMAQANVSPLRTHTMHDIDERARDLKDLSLSLSLSLSLWCVGAFADDEQQVGPTLHHGGNAERNCGRLAHLHEQVWHGDHLHPKAAAGRAGAEAAPSCLRRSILELRAATGHR